MSEINEIEALFGTCKCQAVGHYFHQKGAPGRTADLEVLRDNVTAECC